MANQLKLHALLDRGLDFYPYYKPSMNSDHLPMTLCAMAWLGAADQVLDEYRDDYSKILQKIENKPTELVQWRDAIGQPGCYSALKAYLAAELENKSIEAVVAQYLPEFIPSLAFDAFHPLIRLAYAIEASHQGEVANALAYWIVVHETTPVSNTEICLCDELQTQVAAGPVEFTDFRFGVNLSQLVKTGEYPLGRANSFVLCAEQALDIYRSTRNFFALHLVTATQAARVCSRFMEKSEVLAALTGAILAAHKVVGSPAFDRHNPLPAPKSGDREHMYKYAYACMSEYSEYKDDRYLQEVEAFKQQGLLPEWVSQRAS